MDGAVESVGTICYEIFSTFRFTFKFKLKGERVANEVLYRLFENNKSVHVDFEKTYYYQKEESQKIMEKNSKKSSSLAYWTEKLFKASFVLGLSYWIVSKSNKNISHNFNKLFKF